MRAKAHIRRQSQLSKNPFLRLGGKAVATATKRTFYTPQIRRQAPAKKNLKIFRKARFFPPRPRPFGQGPVKRKATYSTQPKTKSKPLDKKKIRNARAAGVSSRRTPLRQGLRRFTHLREASQVSGGIPILASSSKPLKPHRAQKAQTTSKRHAAVESAPNGTLTSEQKRMERIGSASCRLPAA